MSQATCSKCGASAAPDAVYCEYCGSAIQHMDTSAGSVSDPSANSDSVIEAERWLAKLDDETLQGFSDGWHQTFHSCDVQVCAEWLDDWKSWLKEKKADMPTPPDGEYKKRFDQQLDKWGKTMKSARKELKKAGGQVEVEEKGFFSKLFDWFGITCCFFLVLFVVWSLIGHGKLWNSDMSDETCFILLAISAGAAWATAFDND